MIIWIDLIRLRPLIGGLFLHSFSKKTVKMVKRPSPQFIKYPKIYKSSFPTSTRPLASRKMPVVWTGLFLSDQRCPSGFFMPLGTSSRSGTFGASTPSAPSRHKEPSGHLYPSEKPVHTTPIFLHARAPPCKLGKIHCFFICGLKARTNFSHSTCFILQMCQRINIQKSLTT